MGQYRSNRFDAGSIVLISGFSCAEIVRKKHNREAMRRETRRDETNRSKLRTKSVKETEASILKTTRLTTTLISLDSGPLTGSELKAHGDLASLVERKTRGLV
eukprot:scaffold135404_cov30-Cyclotella_meneghiniana.AAC.2